MLGDRKCSTRAAYYRGSQYGGSRYGLGPRFGLGRVDFKSTATQLYWYILHIVVEDV